MMNRRTFFCGLTLGTLSPPLVAGAQQAGRVYRLGLLSPAAPPSASDRVATVVLVPEALRDLGYVEGRNLVVERRFADRKLDRLPALARDLVQHRVDVIVAVGAAAGAAKEVTKTIPIVMIGRDPVAEGYVESLARPGGNVTGVVISETGLADKRLELLREAVPQATRVAVLATPEPTVKTQVQEAKKAAAALGITLVVVELSADDYDRVFSRMVAEHAAGLVVLSSPILHRDRKTIIALASKHRLPAIYQWREHAEDGGLMAYGSNLTALYRRIAAYVDRLFKGAKPAELPLEQPIRYEFVINMKTARVLGLTIPQSLLIRADQVIE